MHTSLQVTKSRGLIAGPRSVGNSSSFCKRNPFLRWLRKGSVDRRLLLPCLQSHRGYSQQGMPRTDTDGVCPQAGLAKHGKYGKDGIARAARDARAAAPQSGRLRRSRTNGRHRYIDMAIAVHGWDPQRGAQNGPRARLRARVRRTIWPRRETGTRGDRLFQPSTGMSSDAPSADGEAMRSQASGGCFRL